MIVVFFHLQKQNRSEAGGIILVKLFMLSVRKNCGVKVQ